MSCSPVTRLIHGPAVGGIASLNLHGQVTLAYLDPPFFTQRVHRMADERVAFDDRWPNRDTYLHALREVLVAVRPTLAPWGSIVVHVDPKISPWVRLLCNDVFGEYAFASEIVWRYRRWPTKTPNFQRVHDTLLRYRKDPTVAPRWNQSYEPLAASTVATWGEGRQRAVTDSDGRRTRSSTTAEASPGTPLGDVWEIPIVAPSSSERTGFPTQKPILLLARLIGALTAPGELVLDPCCGSGTTLVAAWRAGRDVVGVDASAVAIEVAAKRLRDEGIGFDMTKEVA